MISGDKVSICQRNIIGMKRVGTGIVKKVTKSFVYLEDDRKFDITTLIEAQSKVCSSPHYTNYFIDFDNNKWDKLEIVESRMAVLDGLWRDVFENAQMRNIKGVKDALRKLEKLQ